VSIADADPVEEGDTGTKSMRFALTRTGALDQAAKVHWHTEDGTATVGQDYTARVSRSVRFAAGVSSVTVSVPIIGDRLDEGDETLRVVLDSSTGTPIGDREAVGTIVDNDPPTLSVADESVLERNPTSTATTVLMTFQVRLSRAWNVPVTVSWATVDITATAGADYVAASGTVTIPAGERRAIATVTVNRDRHVEPDETLRLVLSNPSGATIGDGEAIGTIRNDD
jgi:chitinase